MKFFYKVDGKRFAHQHYYKEYYKAFAQMMEYAQALAIADEPLDYVGERKFGWELVYVEKVYFDDECGRWQK